MANFTATRDHNNRAIIIAPDGSAYRLIEGKEGKDEWCKLPSVPFPGDAKDAAHAALIERVATLVETAAKKIGLEAPAPHEEPHVVGSIDPAAPGAPGGTAS